MNPLLQSFIHESRDHIEQASRCLLLLEADPHALPILDELFRAMHTIKGSSGLFEEYRVFTRFLHLIEDHLDQVRSGEDQLQPTAIDTLLNALDLIVYWLDALENTEALPSDAEYVFAEESARLKQGLQAHRQNEASFEAQTEPQTVVKNPPTSLATKSAAPEHPVWWQQVKESQRQQLLIQALDQQQDDSDQKTWFLIRYQPAPECFFIGQDPLFSVRQMPGVMWYRAEPSEPWVNLEDLDPYRCVLGFQLLAYASLPEVQEHWRYVADQVTWIVWPTDLHPAQLFVFPTGEMGATDFYQPFVQQAKQALQVGDISSMKKKLKPVQELSAGQLWQHSVVRWIAWILERIAPEKDQHQPATWQLEALNSLLEALVSSVWQWQPLAPSSAAPEKQQSPALPPNGERGTDESGGVQSRVKQAEKVLIEQLLQNQIAVLTHNQDSHQDSSLSAGCIASVHQVLRRLIRPLGLNEADLNAARQHANAATALIDWIETQALPACQATAVESSPPTPISPPPHSAVEPDPVSARPVAVQTERPERESVTTTQANLSIRVEQKRIDELMNLAGELIVAKNALPFLESRAREGMEPLLLAREIKAQHANLDRITERIQATVMAARMVPFSGVFARFPRLVRDLSRKMNKQVELVLEGEETQADKNLLDRLADPLVHLIRNSLDHGLETPEERQAAGKPPQGRIILSAQAQDDRVLLMVIDDGRGIDCEKLKQKAYQRGLIDEAKLDSLTQEQALQLIFLPGLSTAETVSDVSGRGVGMDAVNSVLQEIGGRISVNSQPGQGTQLQISLPLSMAVARVMMVDIGGQDFGVPMSMIGETVRIATEKIHGIKNHEAITLRDSLIPLRRARQLLSLPPLPSRTEEAILILEVQGQRLGLIIDDFRQGIDIVQKPMEGIMANYTIYSGSALMGDGRVLLVLNLPELLKLN
ncbi:MAG: chemotaxis protein CheA [Marinospirillum sp.]|nr:chemotaxis protein CheA [Marinospirillum sp.]